MTSPRLLTLLFITAVVSFAALILSLPVFPSGDGPLHIYYSSVFWSLAQGSHEYSAFYQIRHLVQPYCLHYFTLISLEHFTTAAVAEKLFVALIFANMALGFRFLSSKLGQSAPLVALFFVPLLLSWSLSAGMLNFCFASGLMFWALGLYVELTAAAKTVSRPFWLFIFVLFLLILAHPVPLLVLICFIAGDCILRFARAEKPGLSNIGHQAWLALALACIAFLIPMTLADRNRLGTIWSDLHPHLDLLGELVLGKRLGMISGVHFFALLNRLALVLLAPISIYLLFPGLRSHWGQRCLSTPDRLTLITIFLLAGTLTLPHEINGSYYFPQRMWGLLWPVLLAPVASITFSKRHTITAAVLAMLLISNSLAVASPVLWQTAQLQNALAAAPLPRHEAGIFVMPESSINGDKGITNYPLLYWSGARAFQKNDDVLLNSPWIDQTTMPIKSAGQGHILMDRLPNRYSEHPSDIEVAMLGPKALRHQVLTGAAFILAAEPRAAHPLPLEHVEELLQTEVPNWRCQSYGFYALCLRR